MMIARGKLLSVVLLLPVLLAWLEDRKPAPRHDTPVASPSPAVLATPSPSPRPEPRVLETPPASPSPSPSPSPSAGPASPTPSSPAPPSPAASPAASPRPPSGRKPSGVAGTATLEGHIYDADTKQPVNKSEVMIPELSQETFSNPNGRFSIKKIPVREKPYEVMIIHPGYQNLYDKKVLNAEERFKFDFFIKRKGF